MPTGKITYWIDHLPTLFSSRESSRCFKPGFPFTLFLEPHLSEADNGAGNKMAESPQLSKIELQSRMWAQEPGAVLRLSSVFEATGCIWILDPLLMSPRIWGNHFSVPHFCHLPKGNDNRIYRRRLRWWLNEMDGSWNVLRPGIARCKGLISISYYGPRSLEGSSKALELTHSNEECCSSYDFLLCAFPGWLTAWSTNRQWCHQRRTAPIFDNIRNWIMAPRYKEREEGVQRKVGHSETPCGEDWQHYVIFSLTA